MGDTHRCLADGYRTEKVLNRGTKDMSTLNCPLKLRLTVLSFSTGISKAHLNFESIRSSGFASFHCG